MSPSFPPELRDLLALQLVPGLGPRRTAALLGHFGTAAAVRRASAAALAEVPGLSSRMAEDFARGLASADVDGELALLERHGTTVLALGRPGYPESLAPMPDAPPILYMRGALTDADARAVALVGSRHCSAYGRRVATQLAAGLARASITVISGLARGIDGISHRGALEAGGRTIAVLAGGLSRIYPPEHVDLSREVEAKGALLSEACMAQEPLPMMFPARNRIISGLSQVVVIVEAAEKSGALITAEHAAEQGRTVMAVPGAVNGSSGGCHALIRDGAVLCRSVDDILEELHGVSAMAQAAKAREKDGVAPAAPVGPPPGLDETQLRIWDFLGTGPRSTDEMAQNLGLTVSQLSTLLMMMEMKKAARRLPGNRYERG